MKPMKRAVEIVDKLFADFQVGAPANYPTTKSYSLHFAGVTALNETPQRRAAREISDAVRPLRDILKLIITECELVSRFSTESMEEKAITALKEWEDIE